MEGVLGLKMTMTNEIRKDLRKEKNVVLRERELNEKLYVNVKENERLESK